MELIRGIHNIRARHHGCVLTIGNFDGVHRGHQALLEQLKQQGKRLGLPVMVAIFEPQPLEMFAADKAPARLTRLRDKANYWRRRASTTCCASSSIRVLPPTPRRRSSPSCWWKNWASNS